MKLTARLTITMVLLCAGTAILVGVVGGLSANNAGEATLRQSVVDRLVSLNDNRAREVNGLLDSARQHLDYLAADPNTLLSTRNLVRAFAGLEIIADANRRDDLLSHYRLEFEAAYRERNGAGVDSRDLVNGLSAVAVTLQARFLMDNPHPGGDKATLDDSGAGDSYDRFHARFHPGFRGFLETFGFYDLFLIDPLHGNIVYSVHKEPDFATSLRNGPYAGSGLAKAYEAALASGQAAFSGVADYHPSFDDPALFLAAPVRAEDGIVIGVLALQMPMPKLDALLTASGDWGRLGLGNSGETYLVGADGGILTQLRDHARDKQGFYTALQQQGLAPAAIAGVSGRAHPSGRLPEPTPAVLSGGSGHLEGKSVMGRNVFKAWRPVQLGTSSAFLVSQQDMDEALAPLASLRQGIALGVGAVTLLVCLGGGLIGWLVAHRIAQPVRKLAQVVGGIASERDLTIRLNTSRRDEIGLIYNALDDMLAGFRELLAGVTRTADQVSLAARETTASSEKNREHVSRQQEETSQVAAAVTEMAASVQEVARNIQEVAEANRDAQDNCQAGGGQVTQLAGRISELAEQVRSSNDKIMALDVDTRRVDEIVTLIAKISEQTNLLALNAAIESARAGEHGRGFAVVADEVRALAARTREAADEVRGTIDRLQSATGDASKAMTEQQQQGLGCVEAAEETGRSFQQISDRVSRVTELTDQVAGAAEEQSQVAEDINRRLVNIAGLAEESTDATNLVVANSNQLTAQAETMEQAARQFRT